MLNERCLLSALVSILFVGVIYLSIYLLTRCDCWVESGRLFVWARHVAALVAIMDVDKGDGGVLIVCLSSHVWETLSFTMPRLCLLLSYDIIHCVLLVLHFHIMHTNTNHKA